MFCPARKSEYSPRFYPLFRLCLGLVAELPKPQADINLSKVKSVCAGKDQERCVSLCEKFNAAGIPFNVYQPRRQYLKGVDETIGLQCHPNFSRRREK